MARSASTSSASPTPAPHTRPFTSRNASKPASPGTRPPRPDSTTAAGAHEVAHAAQLPFRFDGERGTSPHPDSPEYDVQADCSAGATLNEAEQDGYLILEGGDLDEIVTFTNRMNHGTNQVPMSSWSCVPRGTRGRH